MLKTIRKWLRRKETPSAEPEESFFLSDSRYREKLDSNQQRFEDYKKGCADGLKMMRNFAQLPTHKQLKILKEWR